MNKQDFFNLLNTDECAGKVWEFQNENITVTRYQLGDKNLPLIVEDHLNGKGTFFYFPEIIMGGRYLSDWRETYDFIKGKYNDKESEKVG